MPERAAASSETPAQFTRPTTNSLPSVVGPYRILGILGVGGMGTVYAAGSDAHGMAGMGSSNFVWISEVTGESFPFKNASHAPISSCSTRIRSRTSPTSEASAS